jgi:hypothetical protein
MRHITTWALDVYCFDSDIRVHWQLPLEVLVVEISTVMTWVGRLFSKAVLVQKF